VSSLIGEHQPPFPPPLRLLLVPIHFHSTIAVQANTTKEDEVLQSMGQTYDKFGFLDVLVVPILLSLVLALTDVSEAKSWHFPRRGYSA